MADLTPRQQVERAEALKGLGGDPETLVGKTITAVNVETSYDRAYALVLTFDDESDVRVGFWALYADDMGLELELGQAPGATSGQGEA